MNKHIVNPSDYLYPQPVVLVGADVDGRSNFTTVSWVGIANETPPMISVALRHERHSLKGIRQNLTFSVNIPSTDMVKETDYCGIVSGEKVNKAEVCKFKVYYGNVSHAPLIQQCPVCLECEVRHSIDLGSHSLVIGEIKHAHIVQGGLIDGNSDYNKINPIAFITGRTGQYHVVGSFLGDAYCVGKDIK